MRHRPSSIGKSLAAFATVGSLLVGVVPSFGQDLKPRLVASTSDGITATTKCKEWKPGALMASEKCEILKGGVLDEVLAAEKENLACMAKVRPFVAQGKVTRETLTKFGPDRMCDLLKTLG
jgi:hypothetical protein